ncbi:MAG: hypothetical protein JSW56_09355 [Deltaproteobacteria bacterium]|nr:MAG: hypothetical protein JSW56_09355 [Deltaproteobacteria bacterium]
MNKEPRPYRKMARTCRTRPIDKARLEWPPLPPLTAELAELRWDFLSENEMPLIADLWKEGYPELMGSSFDFLFHPERYKGKILLRENYEQDRRDRDRCMFRWEKGGKIVGAMMLTKWDENRQVELTIGTVLPRYRKVGGIFIHGFPIVMDWLQRSGAEYLTAFCETWHDLSQRLLEANGFKICGIFPGQHVRWTSGNRQYRGCTVHYYRFIGQGAEYVTHPEEWRLSERASRVWEVLAKMNGSI